MQGTKQEVYAGVIEIRYRQIGQMETNQSATYWFAEICYTRIEKSRRKRETIF